MDSPSQEPNHRSARAETSPNPRLEVLQVLREDLTTDRHPGDGGGRAWLDPVPPPGAAATPGRWRLRYEAGPHGIAVGGWLFLQVPPFWGWDTPQVRDPQRPGYSRVATDAPGVELVPRTIDSGLLGIEIAGARLESGAVVTIEYGAAPAGALRDRYAEHGSPFYFAVDADGDGVRGLVTERPQVDVLPGPATQLRVVAESTPGTQSATDSWLSFAVLDALGNGGVPIEGQFRVFREGEASTLIETVALTAGDGGIGRVNLPQSPVARSRRYLVRGPEGLEGRSNPVVQDGGPRILWADLHGHSQISDGTGTPEDYFRYARDVAALDVVALTDHDHWGMEPLSTHPDLWNWIRRETKSFHRPHRFVTLLGYEWTSWIHGHRHVLYFEDEGEVFSSVDPDYESPEQLWDALRGRPALTFAHHSAGGPIATNWTIPPDPVLEPVTEIVSVHGSSEAPDSPYPIYSPVAGNWVRNVLAYGDELGFIGSGDSHDGHPGLAHLGGGSGGLAAILSEELTRESVLEALRSRRVYATNGPRIVLRARLAGAQMGSRVPPMREAILTVSVWASAPIERIDLVRSGALIESSKIEAGTADPTEIHREFFLQRLDAGEFVYVRVVQRNGGAAWSSPFFVRSDETNP